MVQTAPSFPLRASRSLAFLLVSVAAFLAAPAAWAADFELGFEGLPDRIVGSPGEAVEVEAFVTLTTTNNDSSDGAQGWLFAVVAHGGVVTGISLDGLSVSAIYEENPDREPGTPAIRHDVERDLGTLRAAGGLSNSAVCRAMRGDEYLGRYAGTAVVLSFVEKYVLAPAGTQRIARITVETRVPADGSCAELSLHFVTETGWSCRDEFGNPISCGAGRSVITFNGASQYPAETSGGPVPVCPIEFKRGDSNADGRVDISDAVYTLGFLYLGGDSTPCRDAADANDDGGVDISDPILLLDRLFISGSRAVIPPPGIYACGLDPAGDGIGCAGYPACSPSS